MSRGLMNAYAGAYLARVFRDRCVDFENACGEGKHERDCFEAMVAAGRKYLEFKKGQDDQPANFGEGKKE